MVSNPTGRIALTPDNVATSNVDRALEFRALAEMIPALVFMTTPDGDNIYTNAQFQRYCGLPASRLLGSAWLDILHPDDRTRVEESWRRSWALGQAYDVRFRIRRFDGDFRWHVVRGVPLNDTEGRVARWIGACTDVDDLAKSVISRTDGDAILEGLAKMPGICVYAKDDQGRFRFASEATLAVLDADADRVIGVTVDPLAAISDEARVLQLNDEAALALGKPCAFDEDWTDAQGVKRTFRSIKMPIALAEGERGILGISIESSPATPEILSLKAELALLRSQIDALPIIAWIANDAGEIVSVNEAWRTASGCPTENAQFSDLIAASYLDRFQSMWDYSVETSEILDVEVEITDRLHGGARMARVVALPKDHVIEGEQAQCWVGTIE